MSDVEGMAMALLEELDPIVYSTCDSGSPCGDPMGFEYWSVDIRLSQLLDRDGWVGARNHREVNRLLAAVASVADFDDV